MRFYSGSYGHDNQLKEIKEKNRAFLLEIEDLKQKLKDAQGDIKVSIILVTLITYKLTSILQKFINLKSSSCLF